MSTARDRRSVVIQSLYESFSQGDLAAALPLLDANVVLVIDDEIPDGGAYFGTNGVREYMTLFLEPWRLLTITALSVEQVGDTFIAKCRQTGVGRESQVATDLIYWQLWTFRGEKVLRIEVVRDETRARELLGS